MRIYFAVQKREICVMSKSVRYIVEAKDNSFQQYLLVSMFKKIFKNYNSRDCCHTK